MSCLYGDTLLAAAHEANRCGRWDRRAQVTNLRYRSEARYTPQLDIDGLNY